MADLTQSHFNFLRDHEFTIKEISVVKKVMHSTGSWGRAIDKARPNTPKKKKKKETWEDVRARVLDQGRSEAGRRTMAAINYIPQPNNESIVFLWSNERDHLTYTATRIDGMVCSLSVDNSLTNSMRDDNWHQLVERLKDLLRESFLERDNGDDVTTYNDDYINEMARQILEADASAVASSMMQGLQEIQRRIDSSYQRVDPFSQRSRTGTSDE